MCYQLRVPTTNARGSLITVMYNYAEITGICMHKSIIRKKESIQMG